MLGRGAIVGQKTNPIGFRLGVNKTWNSRWYAKRDYARLLHEDLKIQNFLNEKLKHAGVAKIEVGRLASKVRVNIHTARPGIVIGKKGTGIDSLSKRFKSRLRDRPATSF